LETDIATARDLKLTVLLNGDTYQRAADQKRQWAGNSRFALLWSNCTTHVAYIASAIGLNTTRGAWVTPQSYVQDLLDSNN
ncbi:MAG: hypothetical protein WAK01_12110, partial [Methylocystis sp.]